MLDPVFLFLLVPRCPVTAHQRVQPNVPPEMSFPGGAVLFCPNPFNYSLTHSICLEFYFPKASSLLVVAN